MSKLGITGGDASFDLTTVDGQACYVRLTAHGLLHIFPAKSLYPTCMTVLDTICRTLSIPVLIDCDYDTGRCFSVDPCSERVYTPNAGGLPR